jgi:hypothetical protein
MKSSAAASSASCRERLAASRPQPLDFRAVDTGGVAGQRTQIALGIDDFVDPR